MAGRLSYFPIEHRKPVALPEIQKMYPWRMSLRDPLTLLDKKLSTSILNKKKALW